MFIIIKQKIVTFSIKTHFILLNQADILKNYQLRQFGLNAADIFE